MYALFMLSKSLKIIDIDRNMSGFWWISYNETRYICTNFSILFWSESLPCFGQFLCPSSGIFHCTHSSGIRHIKQDQDGCSILILLDMTYTTAVCTVKYS